MLRRVTQVLAPIRTALLSAGFILLSAGYAAWQHVGHVSGARMPPIIVRPHPARQANPHAVAASPVPATAPVKLAQASSTIAVQPPPGKPRHMPRREPQAIVSPPVAAPAEPPKSSVEDALPAQAATQVLPRYKDGEFTGDPADIHWGNLQVVAVIKGGQLTDVKFLVYPFERHASLEINGWALPELAEEAIQAQTAKVDIVSQATMTTYGFQDSLGSALAKASQ
jgi:uncharacterized protein with FMN-binding domain